MKSSLIIKEAKEVKAFVEKNKKLPKFCTICNQEVSIYTASYLFAKLLENRKATDIKVITIQSPKSVSKAKINEKITTPDYNDMVKRFVKYCETNKKVPSYVTSVKSKIKVDYDLFVYCICKIIVYCFNNSNTLPLYCEFKDTDMKANAIKVETAKKITTKSTSVAKKATPKKATPKTLFVSEPHYTSEGCNRLGQCTGYWCGPHSIHQCIRKFGITAYTEKQIAGWAGTTTSGTDHNGINTAIAKVSKMSGKKLTVEWKNFSDMGKTDAERFKAIGKLLADPNVAILWHIAYCNGGNGTSGKHFGHYECIDKVNTSSQTIRALNSLGNKKSDGSYTGKLQERKYGVQAYYARNTSGGQKALCIIRRK